VYLYKCICHRAGNNHHHGEDPSGETLNGEVKEESPDIAEAEMEEGQLQPLCLLACLVCVCTFRFFMLLVWFFFSLLQML
jgi:hypothetical protein